jgi:hypothetical protein
VKKLFLLAFIFTDVCVMAGAAVILYLHFSHRSLSDLGVHAPAGISNALPMSSTGTVSAARTSGNTLINPGANVSTTTVAASSTLATATAEPGTRNIKFTYRNPKAHQVSIRADFTGWKAMPMQKDAAGMWAFATALAPGEYAYCYTVDDKTFKDPANKRTKQIGRTFVSAILVKPNTAPH